MLVFTQIPRSETATEYILHSTVTYNKRTVAISPERKMKNNPVLVRVTIAVMSHHDQKQCGEERVYFAHTSIEQFIIKTLRTGTQAGQEPGGRSWCRGQGGALLMRLPPWPAQTASCRIQNHKLGEPQRTTKGWALPINHQLRKCPKVWSYGGIVSTQVPSSLMTLACVKLT